MKPFKPHNLPLSNIKWDKFISLISTANREIARYDGLLQSIPEPLVLLAPLKTKEAVLSSKIEGTQATLEEVFQFESEENTKPDNKDDIHEVINYRKALARAVKEMETRPINLNMLRSIHRILLDGVRGANKDRGNFRRDQNWIGKRGSKQEDARFVPPAPEDLMPSLDNWEKYVHHEENDPLVQLAIVHAQFEIIHPFLDGNGRIGRILIPLFLYNHKIIQEPAFYLSAYLESHRDEYYDSLKSITDTNDWTQWIQFFLNAMIEQARENTEKVKRILKLYQEMKTQITELTHSQFAIKTLDQIFCTPVFSSSRFIRETDVPRASSIRILNVLTENEILKITRKGTGRIPTIYRFTKLMKIIND